MKKLKDKIFLLQNNTDSSWNLYRREIYYFYRMVLLIILGLGLGMVQLVLALGPYATRYFTRFALPGYFTQWKLVTLNALPVMLLIVLCYALIGRTWIAFLLGGSISLCLSLVNYYKLWFRDDPLYFEDIMLFREAKNMVVDGDYRIFVDKLILIAVFGLIIGTIILYFGAPGKTKGWKRRLIQFVVASLLCVILMPFYLDTKIYTGE